MIKLTMIGLMLNSIKITSKRFLNIYHSLSLFCIENVYFGKVI